ncbi:MAG: hypothetical protein HXY39_01465 [Chloroflexi bacterium]|nr:hypothetical protein [Chloroflexota bacterium]
MRGATQNIIAICAAAAIILLSAGVVRSHLNPATSSLPAYAGGYRVDRISYGLDPADPSRLLSVRFRFTPATAGNYTIRARVVRSSASYVPCRRTDSPSDQWICPLPGIAVRSADQLDIVVEEVRPSTYSLYLPIVLRQ